MASEWPAGQVTRKLTPGRTTWVVPTTMGSPPLTTTADTVMPVSAASAAGAANAVRASAPATAARWWTCLRACATSFFSGGCQVAAG
ncbi:hypothetical protein [Streptomyces sp. NPDC048737]|uniref:hypothetical protein n=1 Tax=unclassified Streptomyces TaxID=2593676 RepID=UPI0034245943